MILLAGWLAGWLGVSGDFWGEEMRLLFVGGGSIIPMLRRLKCIGGSYGLFIRVDG